MLLANHSWPASWIIIKSNSRPQPVPERSLPRYPFLYLLPYVTKGSDVQLLLQPEDLEHDDQSNLKLEVVDRKFRGTNFIYTLKTVSNKLIPVFVHSHHIHQHQVDEKFGIKRPINIDHIVCF